MNESDTLHQFIRAFAPEIGGRSTDVVGPELSRSIEAFANGELDEHAIDEVSRELLSNENALETLALLIKGQ
jgi:hypothetical protein